MGGIGANWGSQSSHRMRPEIVVRMLRENGIQKVKLFDADYDTLKALGRSGIQVMVGIPNDMLSDLARSPKAAEKWVSENVTHHLTSNNVMIRSLTLCNLPLVFSYDLDLILQISCLLNRENYHITVTTFIKAFGNMSQRLKIDQFMHYVPAFLQCCCWTKISIRKLT